jgi:hypothetical protein
MQEMREMHRRDFAATAAYTTGLTMALAVSLGRLFGKDKTTNDIELVCWIDLQTSTGHVATATLVCLLRMNACMHTCFFVSQTVSRFPYVSAARY